MGGCFFAWSVFLVLYVGINMSTCFWCWGALKKAEKLNLLPMDRVPFLDRATSLGVDDSHWHEAEGPQPAVAESFSKSQTKQPGLHAWESSALKRRRQAGLLKRIFAGEMGTFWRNWRLKKSKKDCKKGLLFAHQRFSFSFFDVIAFKYL